MSATMKAVQLHEFGGPEVLRYEDVAMPQIADDQVLVRVHAIGVNPPDWYLRDGYRMLPPEWQPAPHFPVIPGTDISGEVAAVGAAVRDFQVGDAVFGMVRFPSYGDSAAYAEYVAAPASDLARKPAGVDHVHAAAAPMAALTAYQFLIDLGHDVPNPLQPNKHEPVPLAGKTVLINGAAGGVGHLALQLAKLHGATVIAVASGGHEAFLRGLGADRFIDYTKGALADAVDCVDLVLDTVGGAAAKRFLPLIKRGGALFPVFPLGFEGTDEAARLGVTVSATQVRSNGAQLAVLAHLMAAGKLQVAIDSSFTLKDAAAAHERAAQGPIRGKIVLTVLPE